MCHDIFLNAIGGRPPALDPIRKEEEREKKTYKVLFKRQWRIHWNLHRSGNLSKDWVLNENSSCLRFIRRRMV